MGNTKTGSRQTPKLSQSKPSMVHEVPLERTDFVCIRCPRTFKKQKGNFPASPSPIYKGNGGYLPICKHCVDELYEHYCVALGNEDEAIRRICMKFDIYFVQEIADASKKISADRSRISAYVSRANLAQYKEKTYDTTLDEEAVQIVGSVDDIKAKDLKITQRVVKFFGLGFSEEEYKFLSEQYDDWTARHECKTKAQEEIFKNICISQLNIQKASQGLIPMKIDAAMTAFQNLLESANLKPKQTNDNALADQNTFGMLIKKWENEKPIPEPEEEWKDVDGIVKYITVYFLGHLCKMMGIKNSYSRAYELEMSTYKVDKPEYEDDDEALFDSVFGGDANDSD